MGGEWAECCGCCGLCVVRLLGLLPWVFCDSSVVHKDKKHYNGMVVSGCLWFCCCGGCFDSFVVLLLVLLFWTVCGSVAGAAT